MTDRLLHRAEAERRSRLLQVTGYRIELDLTRDTGFVSRSRIGFRCSEPGATTFVECAGASARRITLNGVDLDPAVVHRAGRIVLAGLHADNVVEVEADFDYSHDGQGLHRFVDPTDDRVYLYSQSEVYDAHRIFACFDQPQLKAPMTLSVAAPDDWTVLSVAPGRKVRNGRWEFAPTPPIATYLMAVAAGRYVGVRRQHDGIPLGLYCRASLAAFLDSDELFDLVARLVDECHRLFGIRLPFAKYDHVFVPEFMAGAMENPGLVTVRDDFLFRGEVTDERRQLRATTIAHELTHMWFGNLVTLRWWDDLWLNEAFAEMMGHLTTARATRFGNAWVRFGVIRKVAGYQADEGPGTHPVVSDVPDTAHALLSLDSITYTKGAAVLRQLLRDLGEEAFLTAISSYLREHAGGNASLDDLLDAFRSVADGTPPDWARDWLHTPGVNTLVPRVEVDDGRYRTVAVEQVPSSRDPLLREHNLDIGLYRWCDGRLVRDRTLRVPVRGPRTEVPELAGAPAADLLLLNDTDTGWVRTRIDAGSLNVLRSGLARIDDPVTRGLCWQVLFDTVRHAEMPIDDFLAMVLDAAPREDQPAAAAFSATAARTAIDVLGHPRYRPARLRSFADACRAAAFGPGGRPAQWLPGFVAAADRDQAETFGGWLTDVDLPGGTDLTADLRWQMIRRLAVLGLIDTAGIEKEQSRDTTAAGERAAATAMTALPDRAAKEAALAALCGGDSLSNHLLLAYADGLFHPEQVQATCSYVPVVLCLVPRLWEIHPPWLAAQITRAVLPRFHAEPSTARAVAALLAEDLRPGARRIVEVFAADLSLAQRTRARDRA